jgi:hypothetical protein
MKDQYVGDVNDYFKYALLRALAHGTEMTVAWMLTPSDTRNDGQRLAYLQRPDRFAPLDPPLFNALRQLVRDGRRSVSAVEDAGILAGAMYASDVLHDDLESRRQHFDGVWQPCAETRLLFFDPDNGLEISSVAKGRRGSSRYLFWVEVANAHALANSVVIYQHFPRRPRDEFIAELASKSQRLLGCSTVLALATPHVAFLVLPQDEDARSMRERLAAFGARAAEYNTALSVITH